MTLSMDGVIVVYKGSFRLEVTLVRTKNAFKIN